MNITDVLDYTKMIDGDFVFNEQPTELEDPHEIELGGTYNIEVVERYFDSNESQHSKKEKRWHLQFTVIEGNGKQINATVIATEIPPLYAYADTDCRVRVYIASMADKHNIHFIVGNLLACLKHARRKTWPRMLKKKNENS